jgi:MFS family permease
LGGIGLAVGGFGIGTGEFAIMGLLPNVAGDLGISIPKAGHLISAYALGVVIGAPLIAVIAAHWPRHRLLLALMACFAIGNFASALAPGYASLIAVRFIAGLPHGAYFGVASLVAASLVPADQRARAIGRMMLGLTGALLAVAGLLIFAWSLMEEGRESTPDAVVKGVEQPCATVIDRETHGLAVDIEQDGLRSGCHRCGPVIVEPCARNAELSRRVVTTT